MKLASDTNKILARIQNMAMPAAKMECGLEVISVMNAANTAVEAYNMGRQAAMADRRFLIATSVVEGLFSHVFVVDSEAEDKVIKQAIRVGNKLAHSLNEIEQKEFDEFRKLNKD